MKTEIDRKKSDGFGQLNLPIGVEITDTGLEAPQTLDDEQIIALGKTLRKIETASAWWIADYIVFVQQIFAGSGRSRKATYDRVQKLWPEYSRATLQTYASIARRVPPSIRSAKLSFEHHTHIATLFEEKQAPDLMAHYIKMAEQGEATADQLRLMIADTRKGVVTGKPKRGRPAEKIIDIEGAEVGSVGSGEGYARAKPADALPIRREAEPGLMTGSHAQLASDAQRALARLREWYTGKRRKEKELGEWAEDRKQVLIADLKPLLREAEQIVDIFHALTNAEQTGDYISQ